MIRVRLCSYKTGPTLYLLAHITIITLCRLKLKSHATRILRSERNWRKSSLNFCAIDAIHSNEWKTNSTFPNHFHHHLPHMFFSRLFLEKLLQLWCPLILSWIESYGISELLFFFCAILLALIESNLLCYVFLAETTATCKEDKKLEKHSALIGFCIVSIVFFF